MKTVILLNGPARSGKDTLADMLVSKKVQKVKFAETLKEDTHIYYGTSKLFADSYEEIKDVPNIEFNWLSPRQGYIHVSENLIKPLFGDAYYGAKLGLQMLKSPNSVFVCSDSGFEGEATELMRIPNLRVVLVKVIRPGYDFKGDSRSYWVDNYNHITLVNDSTKSEFLNQALDKLKEYIT